MPILFACPTSDPRALIPKIKEYAPRLNGIMTALRSECLEVASTIYREIATKEVPVLTDLLHDFQNGEREDLSDLRLEFPEIPEECYDGEPEKGGSIGSLAETPELYENRIHIALGIARKLGRNVMIVAPTMVIKHLTGIAIQEGEVVTISS